MAVIGWPATTPIISREPVPALPKSRGWRARQAADADPGDAASDPALARDDGAERPGRVGGAQHVVALEQALDPGLADAQQAEDERPVRDRLVAGQARPAAQRAGGAAT